ncbi:uncharacterized protein LOC120073669 [Benincasa hispida]|uniref:uncharacterized protein LOC120073669 n=1 Tax=Benincasa hispida TaxID=102211 RepID=UPI001901194F|nr:uncharacterized protein LOC120073669 [Benincasa hispida]
MALPLPKYVAFRDRDLKKYLQYLDHGPVSGSLQYSSDNMVSVYTKFELEPAKSGEINYVNIRCCYNNKYLASSNDDKYLVTPFVDKPKEDVKSWPCTLFKVGNYISSEGYYTLFDVWRQRLVCPCINSNNYDACLTTRYGSNEGNVQKIHQFIDFEALLVLPKRVAFKGDNGLYLAEYYYNDWEYMQFNCDDIGSSYVSHQVFTMADGSIRIKCEKSGMFWRRDPNWILADSSDTTANDVNTLFWPVKVSKNTVALRSLANNNFCKRLTADDKEDCLNAAAETITKEATLEVVEPVISREIYNVQYRTMNARIYDEKVVSMATGDATNGGTEPTSMEIDLNYKKEKTKSWNSSLTMSLGITTSVKAGVPGIGEAGIETTLSFSGTYEWGETLSTSEEVGTTYTVNVPAQTRMKVTLLATMGTCDVPFSYTQRDVLRSGEQVITNCDDGVYIGANCYNFKYENKPLPLSSP